MKIINNHNEAFATSGLLDSDIKFGIGDAAMIIEIVRNRLYSRPIYTLVQEYISNAIDANIEVGEKPDKIIISAPTIENLIFKVRDYGPGLSKERVAEIFVMYGVSTKRDSNDKSGCFGIGSKSAWSYTDSYIVTSYYNGVKTVYVAHIGKHSEGSLTIFGQEPTDEPNGVEIKIAVNSVDIKEFQKAIVRATFLHENRPIVLNIDDNMFPVPVFSHGGITIYEDSQIDHVGSLNLNINGVLYEANQEKWRKDYYNKHFYVFKVLNSDIPKLSVSASREGFQNSNFATEIIEKHIDNLRNHITKKLLDDSSILYHVEPFIAYLLRTIKHPTINELVFVYNEGRVVVRHPEIIVYKGKTARTSLLNVGHNSLALNQNTQYWPDPLKPGTDFMIDEGRWVSSVEFKRKFNASSREYDNIYTLFKNELGDSYSLSMNDFLKIVSMADAENLKQRVIKSRQPLPKAKHQSATVRKIIGVKKDVEVPISDLPPDTIWVEASDIEKWTSHIRFVYSIRKLDGLGIIKYDCNQPIVSVTQRVECKLPPTFKHISNIYNAIISDKHLEEFFHTYNAADNINISRSVRVVLFRYHPDGKLLKSTYEKLKTIEKDAEYRKIRSDTYMVCSHFKNPNRSLEIFNNIKKDFKLIDFYQNYDFKELRWYIISKIKELANAKNTIPSAE